MLRQTIVHKGVVRIQERQQAAVFPNHAFEQQFRLPAKRLPEISRHLRRARFSLRATPAIAPRNWSPAPASGDPPASGESAARAPPVRAVFLSTARFEELVIGNAAPQEEGEAGRQFQIADAVSGAGGQAGRLLLEAEYEIDPDQHARQRHFNPVVEVSAFVSSPLIEAHQLFQVRIRQRAGGRRESPAWKGSSWRRATRLPRRRAANENAAAAGRVSRSGGIQGSGDGDAGYSDIVRQVSETDRWRRYSPCR